ncbi:MAG: hypothetical protein ABI216_04115 [Devosia sp.]
MSNRLYHFLQSHRKIMQPSTTSAERGKWIRNAAIVGLSAGLLMPLNVCASEASTPASQMVSELQEAAGTSVTLKVNFLNDSDYSRLKP